MKKTILKNTHYAIGLPAFFSPMGCMLKGNDHVVGRRVKFDANCAYDLQDEDQKDWNKIFGVCFGITGIHKNSLRFGWRYNTETRKIELCTIVYREDFAEPERLELSGHDIDLNQWVRLELSFIVSVACVYYMFKVNDTTVHSGAMPMPEALMYFGCGFYFGGNRKAPHKMTLNIEKI